MNLRRNLNTVETIMELTFETIPQISNSSPTTDAACGGSCAGCPAVGSCPDRVVCRCLKVTEETIIVAIRTHGARNLRELKQLTDAGDGCTCCHKELREYLHVYSSSAQLQHQTSERHTSERHA